MPSAPLRPCAAQGCGTLVKSGRCPTHRSQEHREEDTHRGSRQARGYGRAWEKIRAFILRRDHYLCQVCRRATATEVDHIIEKADGGEDTPTNLQAIFSPCHATKTGRSENYRRRQQGAA